MPNFKHIHASVLAALLGITCCYPSFIAAQQSQSASPATSINIQSRAGFTGDSDNDSVPDLIDVDDDNDTIPDDIEGTGDWDGDGVPDCLDIDSDNDGITDLYEAAVSSGFMLLLDSDRDGKLDESVAVGENGLANIVEQPPESGISVTGTADLDGDGIRDHQDLDVDNDGIPDVVEAGSSDDNFNGLYDFFLDLNSDGLADRLWTSPILPRDSDQDGVEDFRDLDSDEDGLTDRLETVGEDTDGDGKVDNFVDANIDGLNDEYESLAMVLPDTDGDSFPDYRDIDSDGDGVTDTEEAFGSSAQSTSITSSTPFMSLPVAQNEEITLQTGESGNVFGCALTKNKTSQQPVDPVFLLLLAASTMFLLRRCAWPVEAASARSTRWAVAFSAIASMVLLTGCTTLELGRLGESTRERQPYAGIGVGASFLNADTSNIPLDQDKSNSVATQITLGLSISERLSAEARFADLGEATFSNGGAVGYQVADASALYKRRNTNLTGFARLGIGALFNDGSVRTTQKNKMHVLVGLGGEIALNPRLALRAEWQGHDVDVMHTQLSVLYRFGVPSKRPVAVIAVDRNRNVSEEQDIARANDNAIPVTPELDQEIIPVEPASAAQSPDALGTDSSLASISTPVEAKPVEPILATPSPSVLLNGPAAATGTNDAADAIVAKDALIITEIEKPSPLSKPDEELALVTPQIDSTVTQAEKLLVIKPIPPKTIPAPVDVDSDGIVDTADKCLGTSIGSPVFSDGCSMFAGAVPGLTFVDDTDLLTESAEVVLDTLVDTLAEKSDIRVTVAVHSGPSTDANAAMFLTRQRTIAIIRYLSEKGIDSTRLRPEAYGDTQPLIGAANPADSNRVVLSSR